MGEYRVEEIQKLVGPILVEQNMELVELTCRPQEGQLHLRLLVDRVGGVTIQQCAQANHLIGQALEAANLMEGSYTIEVSSPGLDRPLVSKRDFERALGEDLRVEITTEEGRFRELHGMLLAVQPEAIVLKTADGNPTIPLGQIRRALKAIHF